MKKFILYGTSCCHLCEEAATLMEAELPSVQGVAWIEAEISDDDGLMQRYGERIPVVLHPDGRELGWPFDAVSLREFLLS